MVRTFISRFFFLVADKDKDALCSYLYDFMFRLPPHAAVVRVYHAYVLHTSNEKQDTFYLFYRSNAENICYKRGSADDTTPTVPPDLRVKYSYTRSGRCLSALKYVDDGKRNR